jgi:hypothetical protein
MSIQAETWKPGAQPPPRSVAEAFAYCERLARTHYENFPVGSLLIPRDRRRHVYSVYAFARIADDFADEGYETGELTEAGRLTALDDWERKLENCYQGRADHPVFVALAETVRELRLPVQLFRGLLSAFKQDVVKRRYADFDEVLDYSRARRIRSAALSCFCSVTAKSACMNFRIAFAPGCNSQIFGRMWKLTYGRIESICLKMRWPDSESATTTCERNDSASVTPRCSSFRSNGPGICSIAENRCRTWSMGGWPSS